MLRAILSEILKGGGMEKIVDPLHIHPEAHGSHTMHSVLWKS